MSENRGLITASCRNDADCALRSPAVPKSTKYGLVIEACFARPLHQCLRFAESGDDVIVRLVILLLSRCGPSAIFFAVSKFIANSVERVSGRRRLTHVFMEILERVKPSLANGDAECAVFFIARRFWIVAASLDAPPRSVDLRSAASVFLWKTRHMTSDYMAEAGYS
jgi:hypothetical protein